MTDLEHRGHGRTITGSESGTWVPLNALAKYGIVGRPMHAKQRVATLQCTDPAIDNLIFRSKSELGGENSCASERRKIISFYYSFFSLSSPCSPF